MFQNDSEHIIQSSNHPVKNSFRKTSATLRKITDLRNFSHKYYASKTVTELRNTPYGAAYDHYGGYAGITQVLRRLHRCYRGVTQGYAGVTQVLRSFFLHYGDP